MNDVPLRSYVYYARCELFDVLDYLQQVISRLDDECSKAIVSDIYNDVENLIDKLKNLSL